MKNDDREKKEIKAEAQRCALSEKCFGPFGTTTTRGSSTVKLFFFSSTATHSFFEFFPPQKPKEMKERQ
jgi:hypothetical protein